MAQLKRILVLAVIALFLQSVPAYGLTNPTHFVDTQWSLFAESGYNSLEVDITVETEEDTASDGYYFANTVYFRNYTGDNFGGAYAGFQTNGYNGSSYVGKMAIFSVWDVGSGIKEPGGWGTTFGGEGTGYSVRIPYEWQTGRTYRLKIYIDDDKTSGDRLWAASLTDLTTNTTSRIGRIGVPVSRGKIYGPVTFHERYLGSTASCGDVKKSQVKFTNASANNGAVKAPSWSNYFIAPVPECPGLTWLRDISGGVQSGIATTEPAMTKPAVQAPQATNPSITPVEDTKEKPPLPPEETEPFSTPKDFVSDPETKEESAAAGTGSNAVLFIGLFFLSIVFLSVLGLLVHMIYKRKSYQKYLQKHFPIDTDHR